MATETDVAPKTGHDDACYVGGRGLRHRSDRVRDHGRRCDPVTGRPPTTGNVIIPGTVIDERPVQDDPPPGVTRIWGEGGRNDTELRADHFQR